MCRGLLTLAGVYGSKIDLVEDRVIVGHETHGPRLSSSEERLMIGSCHDLSYHECVLTCNRSIAQVTECHG